MSFDIIMKTPGKELPPLEPGQFRYVLGRDGLSMERCTPMYTSSVKVDGPIPFLEEHPQHCQLHCGSIPSEMLQQMVGFFQAAYKMHGGEAALVLLYYPETGTFAWHCPQQKIHFYSWWGKLYVDDTVEYDNPLTLPEGAVHFGDAHSHTGPPTPSITDQNDEAHLDGLHLIVGYVGSQRPTWHLDFCMDGNRFSVPTDVIFEAIPEAPFPEPPEEWMKQIQLIYPESHTKSKSKSSSNSSWQGGTYQTSNYSSTGNSGSYYNKSNFSSTNDDDNEPHSGSETYAKEQPTEDSNNAEEDS